MPGIHFVSTFEGDPFIKSANAIMNSVKTMAAQVEARGGQMQEAFDRVFNNGQLTKNFERFLDNIIESFSLTEKAAENFKSKVSDAISTIASSGDDATTKLSKIATIVAQLSSESKQIDMAGLNDNDGSLKTLEDTGIAANILIDKFKELDDVVEGYENKISQFKGGEFYKNKDDIIAYGEALQEAFDGADEAYKAQEGYVKGLEAQLQKITDQLNATNDKTLIAELNQQASELTQQLDIAKGTMQGLAEYKENVQLRIANNDEIKETIQQLDELKNKVPGIVHALDQIKFGTDEANNAFEKYATRMTSLSEGVKGTLKSIATLAGIAFGIHEVKSFINSVAQTREDFQDIESSMKVFLGNEAKATEFVNKLKDYAWYNMFEFKDLTKASQQMIAYGQDVDTIIPKLDMLSNIAAGTHAPLMEMVDAYNRAKSTGVVDAAGVKSWATKGVVIKDVLKEMGEAASGTQITFEQLNKVLEHLTGEGGMFHNLMGEQLSNISAEKGQLEDNLTNMFNEIGEKFQGTIIKWYKLKSDMVDNYTDIAGGEGTIDFVVNFAETGMDSLMENWKSLISVIKEAVAIYGSWKVAVIAANAIRKAKILLISLEKEAEVMNSIATEAQIALEGKATVATVARTRAVQALNSSLLASPYTWLAVAIAGVTYGIYKLVTAESAAEAGVRKANEALQEQSDLLNERKDNINNLISTIQDRNQTEYAQLDAYKKLKAIAPEITDAYTREQLAMMSLDDVAKLLNKDLDDMTYDQAKKNVDEYTEKVNKLQKNIDDYFNSPTAQSGDKTGAVITKYRQELETAKAELQQYQEKLREIESLRKEAIEKAKPIEIRIQEANNNYQAKKNVLDFYDQAMILAKNVDEANGEMAMTAIDGTNIMVEDTRTNYQKARDEFDAFIGQLEKVLDDPLNVKVGTEREKLEQLKSELEQMRDGWQGIFNSPILVKFRLSFQNAQSDEEAARTAQREGMHFVESMIGNEQNGGKRGYWEADAKQEARRTKEVIQNELKQTQSAIDSMTAAEAKADKAKSDGYAAKRKKLQEELKAYSDTSKDDQKKAKEESTKNAKQLQEQWKHEEAMSDLEEKAQRARTAASIAGIQNQAERERKEREVQYQQTLEDLKNQEDEIYKTIYQQRKTAYENAHKNDKDGGHYENTEEGKAGYQSEEAQESMRKSLTDKERKQFDLNQQYYDAKRDEATANNSRRILEEQKAQIQAMRDYLKEYGSYEQQRLAIAQEYAQKIAEAEEGGNNMEAARLRAEQQAKNAEMEFKKMQDSINWELVFNDLDKLSTQSLNDLKEKLRKALDAKDITVENAKVLSEKILEIENRISDKTNLWGSMIPALRERQRLVNEVRNAEEDIARAQEKILSSSMEATRTQSDLQRQANLFLGRNLTKEELSASSGTEFINKINKSIEESNVGLDVFSQKLPITGQAAENLKKAFDNNVIATTNLEKAQEELTAAQKNGIYVNNLLKNLTGKGAKDQNFGSAITSIFNNAVEAEGGGFMGYAKLLQTNVNSMADFTDKIGLAGTDFGDAVHGFSEGVNGFMSAIQSLASGDIFGFANGVIDGIQGYGKAITAIFGVNWSGGNEEEHDRIEQELIKANEGLQRSIDKLKESFDNANGVRAIEISNDIIEKQRQFNDNVMERWENDMGYHSAHHSNAYNWEGFSSEQISRMNALLAQMDEMYGNAKDRNGNTARINGSDWSELTNLTPEALDYIRAYLPDIWDFITSRGEYSWVYDSLNEYADLSGKIAEQTEALAENLTQLSASSLHDQFLSDLMDMKKSAKDFGDDFTEILAKAVLNAQIGDLMDADLKAWRDDLAERMKKEGGLNPDDVKELRESWDAIVAKGMEARDTMAQVTGYTGESSSQQSAAFNSAENITYEQADALVGILTAQLIVQEQGNQTRDLILANLQTMSGLLTGDNGILSMIATANTQRESMIKIMKEHFSNFTAQMNRIVTTIQEQ